MPHTTEKTTKKTINKTNNKKRTPKKKPTKLAPKKQRIDTAFRRATEGRLCPVCDKRYSNAVYQRHFDKCQLPEDDEEIIFCEIVGEGTPRAKVNPKLEKPTPSSILRDSIVIRKKVYEDEGVGQQKLKEEGISTYKSRFLALSTTEFFNELEAIYSNNSNDEENNQPLAEQIPIEKSNCGDITLSEVYGVEELEEEEINSNNPNENGQQEAIPKKKLYFEGIPLCEVYSECLKKLNKFMQERGEFRQPLKNMESSQNSNDGFGGIGMMDESQNGENEQQNEFNKVHYSLRFIWKILQNVLLCPEHENSAEAAQKFWGEYSLRLVLALLSVSVKAQHLFSRLLIRRWDWLIARDIKYEELGNDLMPFLMELRDNGLMEDAFTSGSISIETAIGLMNADDLKPISKMLLKLDSGTRLGRKTIIKKLQNYAAQKNVFNKSNRENLFNCIKSQIGECFRIDENALDLFNAFFTIYSPNLMDTAQLIDKFQQQGQLNGQLIFTMLQHQQGEISFMGPSCLPRSLIGLYPTLDALMGYIRAKNGEQKLRKMIDKNECGEAWELAENQKKEFIANFIEGENPSILHFMELPIYLRKYTPPWVHCRCIFHGIEVAQKLKNHQKAVEWLKFLLKKEEFKHFCVNFRGHWYNRLALNLGHHLKAKEAAIETCFAGIQDPLVGQKYKLELQNRLEKLSTRMDWQIQGQTPIVLIEPEKVQIVGKIIGKGLGDGVQVNHFYLPSTSFSSTPQQAQREEINKCSVEQIALHHFLEKEGFREGVHCEGAIWHFLFRLFFSDIIFCPHLDHVWISPLQEDPLDLNYSDFYENRRSQIDERLNQIAGTPGSVEFYVHRHSLKKRNGSSANSNSHIGWHRFNDDDQLLRFLRCCPPQFLHDLFKRLCTDFANTRSGFPDLVVWNGDTKQLAVVEVKGPNDQLSTKQQLWLDFFQSRGVRAVLCNVSAKNDRALD